MSLLDRLKRESTPNKREDFVISLGVRKEKKQISERKTDDETDTEIDVVENQQEREPQTQTEKKSVNIVDLRTSGIENQEVLNLLKSFQLKTSREETPEPQTETKEAGVEERKEETPDDELFETVVDGSMVEEQEEIEEYSKATIIKKLPFFITLAREGFVLSTDEEQSKTKESKTHNKRQLDRVRKIKQKGLVDRFREMDNEIDIPHKYIDYLKTSDESDVLLGDSSIKTRLGDHMDQDLYKYSKTNDGKFKIKLSKHYLNNRAVFQNHILKHFDQYKKEIERELEANSSCGNRIKGEFSILTHQKIVRDYLSISTPYRGLLLYHGLGSGKTCSSIAIAEGLKYNKRVIVMTPASLEKNYQEQLKFCGDILYRRNHFWEKITSDGNEEIERILSTTLHIPIKIIKKMNGAYMVNLSKEPNYDMLSEVEKAELNKQINLMINMKYSFIHYNGLRNDSKMFKPYTSEEGLHYNENPFDNKVIIIDEAHNIVSRINNKLKEPRSIFNKIYNWLLSAENCRVVLLTGTPLVNYPNEIGILFNMIRGCVKRFEMSVENKSTSRLDKKYLNNILSSVSSKDIVEYTNNKLTVTRNPYGFSTMYKKDGKDKINNGVIYNNLNDITDEEFMNEIKNTLLRNKINVLNNKKICEKPLNDDPELFDNDFIKNAQLHNKMKLQKRLIGMISYFSDIVSLMPRYDEEDEEYYEIKYSYMSDHQFSQYEEKRKAERKMSKKKKGPNGEEEDGSSYRIFSRLFCNFVFPSEIERPLPINQDKLNLLVEQETQDVERIESGRKQTDEEKTQDEMKNKEVSSIVEHIDEHDMDGMNDKDKLNLEDGSASVDEVDIAEKNKSIMSVGKDVVNYTYQQNLIEAYNKLVSNADKYLSLEALELYSPKFKNIIENIIVLNGNPMTSGKHLIYSQFRSLEGIGILSAAMKQNGFGVFDIKYNSDTRQWNLHRDVDFSKKNLVLYTGTESEEKREIIRNIFNNDYDYVPDNLKNEILERMKTFTDIENVSELTNTNGEIINTIMITASGAEGINFKAVLYVHIVEPYWHPVRLEQIIGRARRICSHEDLPDEKQFIKVFVYMMKLTEKQIESSRSLQFKDKSKNKYKMVFNGREIIQKERLDSKMDIIEDTKSSSSREYEEYSHFTTDETLYELSIIKKNINKQILKAIKETAIDCKLHDETNQKENLKCFTFEGTNTEQLSYQLQMKNEQSDDVAKLNAVTKKTTYKQKTIDYIIGSNTKKIYKQGVFGYIPGNNEFYFYDKKNDKHIKVGKMVKVKKGGVEMRLVNVVKKYENYFVQDSGDEPADALVQ